MRIVVRSNAFRLVLVWTQRLLLTVAVLSLGYCGLAELDSWLFQRSELSDLNQMVRAPRDPVESGLLVGRLEATGIGLSAMVVEGTDEATLRRAAGHIENTGMPGVPGNVGIAAHRDTFFRPLRNIRQNDVITLTTRAAQYRYRVVSTRIVEPDDVSVLDSCAGEVLTLVTCYPFYFIGSAPERFVVRAERVI